MNRKTLVKMSLSILILCLAIIAAIVKKTPYALLAMPAMLLGAHGDFCLTQTPMVKKLYKEPFLTGAMSFLIGHLFYIIAFATAARLSAGPFWGAFLIYGILAVIAWMTAMRGGSHGTAFRIALLAYGLVIALMASFGFALAAARGGAFWLAAIGGALFVVSDGIIALNDFGGIKIPRADLLIWATYVPAQLLIVLAGFFS